MILDLDRFLAAGRPSWSELEERLDRLDADPGLRLGVADVTRLHYLYRRAASDLARFATFSSEPEIHSYLEALVARAYGEVHALRPRGRQIMLWRLLSRSAPRAFRRHLGAFGLAVLATVAGAAFGGAAMVLDPAARSIVLPAELAAWPPAERVAWEESLRTDRLHGVRTRFSAQLFTHNTQVSIFCLALGITWGAGTLMLLFFNGVILGAVVADYLGAGYGAFLFGWLLPHGAIEIPAILIAGQAGLVLAGALLGRSNPLPLRARLRDVTADLGTLVALCAILLGWAGLVEAFLSQYHAPVLPYGLKIAFGTIEVAALATFLARAGGREA